MEFIRLEKKQEEGRWIIMDDLQRFMRYFEQYCLSKDEIQNVEFFGSAVTRPNEWVKGKSDIDIFVFGINISAETKRLIHKLFWELNDKYKLELKKPAAIHPLVFFIDSLARRKFYSMFKNYPFDSPEFRNILKKLAPPAEFFRNLSLTIPDPLWKLA